MESDLNCDEVCEFYKNQLENIREIKRIVQDFDPHFIEHTRFNMISNPCSTKL